MREQFTKKEQAALLEAFSKIKAEDDVILRTHLESVFVKTEFYDNAQLDGKCLLVGRKGSGKTAVLYGHKTIHKDRYFTSEEISIDDLPFPAFFNFFYQDFLKSRDTLKSKRTIESDSLDFIQPERLSHYAWMNSICGVCIMHTARDLLVEDSALTFLSSEDRKILTDAVKYLARCAGTDYDSIITTTKKNKTVIFTLLLFFFRRVQSVVEETLEQELGGLNFVLSAILTRLINMMNKGLDIDLVQVNSIIRKYLNQRGQSVLLTLDKFDDFYDSFYKDTNVTSENGRFAKNTSHQKDLLSVILDGLLIAARDISKSSQFDWLDTLFTIPMDKFLEVHLRERMEFEQNHLLFVEWNPRELYEFANNRIADALELTGRQREYAWFELFPDTIQNGNSRVRNREESFFYIVRHTLWKPRELQTHIKTVIEEVIRNDGKPLQEDEIRKCIRTASKDIIRQEFLEEFVKEYPGIGKTLQHLENVKLSSVMDYTEYVSIVGKQAMSSDVYRADDIVLRHFHMGLIGIRRERPANVTGKNATVRQNEKNIQYSFNYNSLETNPFSDTDHIKVVIHPLFFDQLGVTHSENYTVNELRWSMYPKDEK